MDIFHDFQDGLNIGKMILKGLPHDLEILYLLVYKH